MESSSTEIIDPAKVKAEVTAHLGDAIKRIQDLANNVKDDASLQEAVQAGIELKAKVKWLEDKREQLYVPLYRAAENVRMEFDPHIKLGKDLVKTVESGMTRYKEEKRRQERLQREAAEAAARKAKEEAEAKRKAAEEAERRAKEQEEARKREEEAERQRIIDAKKRDDEAKAKAEADKRTAEAAALAAQKKAEEEARLAQAMEAERVGNVDRIDVIVATPAPLPVAAPTIPAGPTPEELAAKAKADAEEKERRAEADRRAEEARRKEAEDKEKAEALRIEAEAAAAKEREAQLALSQKSVATRPDDNTRTTTTWKYIIPNRAAFLQLAKAVVEDRAPAEYLGWNDDKPEAFRPAAIGKDVVRMKDLFKCDGIEAWPEVADRLVAPK